jgi:hypothetical protein
MRDIHYDARPAPAPAPVSTCFHFSLRRLHCHPNAPDPTRTVVNSVPVSGSPSPIILIPIDLFQRVHLRGVVSALLGSEHCCITAQRPRNPP